MGIGWFWESGAGVWRGTLVLENLTCARTGLAAWDWKVWNLLGAPRGRVIPGRRKEEIGGILVDTSGYRQWLPLVTIPQRCGGLHCSKRAIFCKEGAKAAESALSTRRKVSPA